MLLALLVRLCFHSPCERVQCVHEFRSWVGAAASLTHVGEGFVSIKTTMLDEVRHDHRCRAADARLAMAEDIAVRQVAGDKVGGRVEVSADLGAAVVLEAHIEVFQRVRKVARAATSNDGFYISR